MNHYLEFLGFLFENAKAKEMKTKLEKKVGYYFKIHWNTVYNYKPVAFQGPDVSLGRVSNKVKQTWHGPRPLCKSGVCHKDSGFCLIRPNYMLVKQISSVSPVLVQACPNRLPVSDCM
jgi:hypothetical protein